MEKIKNKLIENSIKAGQKKALMDMMFWVQNVAVINQFTTDYIVSHLEKELKELRET